MAIAITLREYLADKGVAYDVIDHPLTESTMKTAEVAHIPGDQMVKSVLLKDERGYVEAVLPATHRLELAALSQLLHRRLGLTSEDELDRVFADCDTGSVPPVGAAYGVDTVMEESLMLQPDIYFESGDHGEAIHVRGAAFRQLMADARTAHFSRHL